jgi:uncharacterized protein YndB with AHSA1/START domain
VSTFKNSRAFAAPPKAVFDALSDPARLASWWGSDGFPNMVETFEFKPWSLWHFIMHGPDGANYPNQSPFVSIEPALEVAEVAASMRHIVEPANEQNLSRWAAEVARHSRSSF